jgi:hypothetical protein
MTEISRREELKASMTAVASFAAPRAVRGAEPEIVISNSNALTVSSARTAFGELGSSSCSRHSQSPRWHQIAWRREAQVHSRGHHIGQPDSGSERQPTVDRCRPRRDAIRLRSQRDHPCGTDRSGEVADSVSHRVLFRCAGPAWHEVHLQNQQESIPIDRCVARCDGDDDAGRRLPIRSVAICTSSTAVDAIIS